LQAAMDSKNESRVNGWLAPLIWLGKFVVGAERVLGTFATAVAAVLIIIEVVLLLSGVTARYVFDAPIGWTGALADMLFLWLSGLGRSEEHTAELQSRGHHVCHLLPEKQKKLIQVH